MRLIVLAAALAAALSFGSSCARADSDPDAFTDCTSAGNAIDVAINAQGWTCAEMARRRINASAEYGFPARIVRTSTIDDASFKSVVPQLLDKLEAAFKIWAGKADLGFPGRMTILLVDPAGKDMPGLPEHGVVTMAGQSECIMRINLAGIVSDLSNGKKSEDPGAGDVWVIPPGGASEIPREIDKVVAHEAAHCVQSWRNAAQAKLGGKGADWWMEGSAEMLASLAVPRANTTMTRYHQFDADSATLPLTLMSYQSVVFWQWLWNEDPKKVLAAWDAMPTGQGGAPAQTKALYDFFQSNLGGDDGFQRFAQDYLDGKIKDVTGQSITAADYGTPLEVTGETASLDMDAKDFTIWRKQLIFSGGEYTIAAAAGDLGLSYATPGGAWAKPVPEHSPQSDCISPVTWNLSVMRKEPLKLNGALSFTRDKKCESCEVTAVRDQCLAGDWIFDHDAMATLLIKLLKQDIPNPDPTLGGQDMTLRLDASGQGELKANDFQVFVTITQKMGTGSVMASMWVGTGGSIPLKWSTTGQTSGNMKMCRSGENDFSLATMVTLSDLKTGSLIGKTLYTEVPTDAELPTFSYTCSGDTILLTAVGATLDGTPISWALHRIK